MYSTSVQETYIEETETKISLKSKFSGYGECWEDVFVLTRRTFVEAKSHELIFTVIFSSGYAVKTDQSSEDTSMNFGHGDIVLSRDMNDHITKWQD